MNQVIRVDGRFIRLIPRNEFADPKESPIVRIKCDDRGGYVASTSEGSFQARDVSRLWESR
jgi:hypothetical protein